MMWMNQGLHYHKSGDFEQAKICYTKSLVAQSNNYQTLQLLGALMHKLNKPEQAIDYLRKSLAIEPKQAHVINTLGNVYKAAGQFGLAQRQYELSLLLKPDYIDPYLNLSSLLLDSSSEEELTSVMLKAEQYFADNWRFIALKAKLAKHQKHYGHAIELLLKANKLSLNQVTILHDLGLAYRLNGQSSLAIECYQKIEQLGHRSEAFFHNYANALSDSSASQEALEYYSKALQINPLARETLLNWCDLMWESGNSKHMFSAYEQAISSAVAPAEIYIDYIQKLLRIMQIDRAQVILNKMLSVHPENAHCQVASVAINRSLKIYEYDKQALRTIFQQTTLCLNDKLDTIEYLMEAGAIDYAYTQLNGLMQTYPDDQLLLALMHTCSRLLPDRDYSFCLLEEYLFEYRIKAPENTTLEAYLADLKDYLLALHSSKEQPLEQTLHKGTQTRGNLFDQAHPLLNHIKSQYKLAVSAYIKKLRHMPELYPGFWQDKSTEFSGSWSVALKQSGFHNHHVHPMGWLSSACYIALPTISEHSNQGYFQIGVPNLANSGLGLAPLKEVKPELGKLVLFPSMLWHGTVPFEENSLRLSIACDIVYANNNLTL
jgi:tetratricopeptide (TPR) repeat protein